MRLHCSSPTRRHQRYFAHSRHPRQRPRVLQAVREDTGAAEEEKRDGDHSRCAASQHCPYLRFPSRHRTNRKRGDTRASQSVGVHCRCARGRPSVLVFSISRGHRSANFLRGICAHQDLHGSSRSHQKVGNLMPGTSDPIILDCGCTYSLRRLFHEQVGVSAAIDGKGVICSECRPALESKHLKDIREVVEELVKTATIPTIFGDPIPCWCSDWLPGRDHEEDCQTRRALVAKWRA